MVKVAKGVGSLEAATKTTGTLCSWNKLKISRGPIVSAGSRMWAGSIPWVKIEKFDA
jgi:hypothetical protein